MSREMAQAETVVLAWLDCGGAEDWSTASIRDLLGRLDALPRARPISRDCVCMDRCRGKCGHGDAIARIRRAVEARLPEDEPDCTAAWVYRVAVEAAPRPREELRPPTGEER